MNNSPEIVELKTAYLAAVAEQNVSLMYALADRLLTLSPTLGIAQQIVNTLPSALPSRPAVAMKVAFLRSFTVEPLFPLLKALVRLHGIDLTIKVGEFNSYAQEIIDPTSWLYEFEPDLVILTTQTRDLAPDIWNWTLNVAADTAELVVDDMLTPLISLVGQFRSRSNATVILQTLDQPYIESAGILDSRSTIGQAEIIRQINRKLCLAAIEHKGVYVLDYDGLIARHGRKHWNDEKKWLTSRSAISADSLIHMAKEYVRFIVPLAGRQSKVLVVDLDNTLWGGVVGEEGVTGIKIGQEYPGASYLALQRAILDIAERGVLLAVCSKNNEADALDAMENRQEMLLRKKHFAALRINWIDKAQNLRDIATELNVGTDSLVFLDDNPVERERVRLELPEVAVIELPDDAIGYAAALRQSPVFERLSITAEDRDRGRFYSEQKERQVLASSAGSLEDFYRSLEMKAEFVAVSPTTIERIAQLTQKTNQLNMTTRRYTEQEVRALSESTDWRLFGIKIIDKFGDNGIVGVVFLKIEGETADIDTFLLSCRVIGRTVETAMLSYVDEFARAAGCKKVTGWFFETKKNEPAKKIYSNNNFVLCEQLNTDTLWELDLTKTTIKVPEWIS